MESLGWIWGMASHSTRTNAAAHGTVCTRERPPSGILHLEWNKYKSHLCLCSEEQWNTIRANEAGDNCILIRECLFSNGQKEAQLHRHGEQSHREGQQPARPCKPYLPQFVKCFPGLELFPVIPHVTKTRKQWENQSLNALGTALQWALQKVHWL